MNIHTRNQEMIEFKQMSLINGLCRIWPAYRKKEDAEMRQAISYLIKHPEESCVVDGQLIPDGYGHNTSTHWLISS